jgi:LysR family hydrogen peroxide-inducible transcriptional activator
MTLQQLQYIIALDEHRHFVRAARSCHVAQPTLTLQVKKLEDQIGISIFDRSSKPIRPTPLGERFIRQARHILREVDALKDLVRKERQEVAGNYRIGIIPSLSPYLLPSFLHRFAPQFPEIQLEVRELQSQQIIEGLSTNRLDIGLLATPLEEERLREIPLFLEPFLLYAHPGHPLLQREELHLGELNEKGLWLLEDGHCLRNQTLNICHRPDHLAEQENIFFESGSIETVKRMVREISGYTLIPELAYAPRQDKAQIRRFAAPEPAREISLVVHHSFTRELLLSRLSETILEVIPARFQTAGKFRRIAWR